MVAISGLVVDAPAVVIQQPIDGDFEVGARLQVVEQQHVVEIDVAPVAALTSLAVAALGHPGLLAERTVAPAVAHREDVGLAVFADVLVDIGEDGPSIDSLLHSPNFACVRACRKDRFSCKAGKPPRSAGTRPRRFFPSVDGAGYPVRAGWW